MTHAYDPDLAAWSERLPPVDYSDLSRARTHIAELFARQPAAPNSGMTVEDTTTNDHADQAVPLRIYRPTQPDPHPLCLLYLHGGGFVTGDLQMADLRARRFVTNLAITVVCVDYRLAPEHPSQRVSKTATPP